MKFDQSRLQYMKKRHKKIKKKTFIWDNSNYFVKIIILSGTAISFYFISNQYNKLSIFSASFISFGYIQEIIWPNIQQIMQLTEFF